MSEVQALGDRTENLVLQLPHDEESNNGFIVGDKYMPEEIIIELLCWLDLKSLHKCQLVCKSWNALIQHCVWRRKAELEAKMMGHSLPVYETAPWTVYCSLAHCIRTKMFDHNLINNHSGKDGTLSWTDIVGVWFGECSPSWVPNLPDDPVFEGNLHCSFVTINLMDCRKHQTIDLIEKGFQKDLLDIVRPPIQVSDYYLTGYGFGKYQCKIWLLTEEDDILDTYYFSLKLNENQKFEWSKFEHQFVGYSKGLRKIRFSHGGYNVKDGVVMAGACIKLKLPTHKD